MNTVKDGTMTVWLNKEEFSSLMFLTGWGGMYYMADNREVETYLRNFMSRLDYKKFKEVEPEFVTFRRIK